MIHPAKRKAKRVLIYRLGSLGDTIVALPSFHLIAKVFPRAERRVLTSFPLGGKVTPIGTILNMTGLVDDYISYPLKLRNLKQLLSLRGEIKQWEPDCLIYLAEPRGKLKILRDLLFFKFCGIKTLIGIPYKSSLSKNQWLAEHQYYEHEAVRLARCLASIGDARLNDSESWNLHLTSQEENSACNILEISKRKNKFIACSIGTKVDVKDWGEKNWGDLIKQLSSHYRGYGLIMIGAKDEFVRSESLIQDWHGFKLNLCGTLTPRESAAVIKHASIFIGHDSGPMHLAACVGTPCVAIFSSRNKPGIWFPYGEKHKVIYHKTDCYDCKLNECEQYNKKCIMSITVGEVMSAINQVLKNI